MHRLPLLAVTAMWIAAGGAACSLEGNCITREVPVSRLDGGVFDCIRAEDCPRAPGVLVCVNNGEREKDCVDCVQTRCVRTNPQGCR